MRIIETDKSLPASLKSTDRDWVYNGLDCCITAEVLDALLPQLDDTTSRTYRFARDLQAPVLEMRLRGVLIDQARKAEVIDDYFEKLDQLERQLERIVIEGLGFNGFNWRSPAQKAKLFYEILQIPVIKKGGRPTTERAALERIDAYLIARPIVRHLLLMEDLKKKISMLKTEIDADGRMRTSYNIAGTVTGRLSSSFSEFGTGCVRPDAEALTRHGWWPIKDIKDGDEIAQYDAGVITFVKCKMHEEHFEGDLIAWNSSQTGLAVTPGHRVLWWNAYDGWHIDPAEKLLGAKQTRIPLGGVHDGSLSYPPYLPMLMADFSMEGYYWRGSFKKQRKIDRFLQLAELYGFEYSEQKAPTGYRRFAVKVSPRLPKEWGPWVLELTAENAEELIEEARYWDATDRGSGFIFYTASREQASWFATLAHIAGRSATIRIVQQHPNSYSDTIMFWVNVKSRDYAQIVEKHWYTIPYKGPVFCPIVPSSFWLVREDGYISVTGNTNLQNIEETLRSVFISDPGYKMAYLDAAQGESRVVGAIEWNLFKDGKYLDACESGDLHTSVARICWPHLAWTGSAVGDRELAEQPYYRHYSRRFMCKKIGHGTNYAGKPRTLSQQAKVDIGVIEDFQPLYFRAFPAHLGWHEWVKHQLFTVGNLTSLMGRRRWFFGRRDSDETFRAAVAYDPQGSLGDIVNAGMLEVWRAGACQLLMQIHDAVLIQYPEDREDEVIPLVKDQLCQRVALKHGRDLVIPYDCKTGWNWGEWSEENPDGLKAYRPGDKRKRTPPVGLLDRRFR